MNFHNCGGLNKRRVTYGVSFLRCDRMAFEL